MNYELDIITREQIPNSIYLCDGINDEWSMIHRFKFDNELEFYIGSNRSIGNVDEAIEMLKNDYDTFIDFNSPSEIQEYFYNEIDMFVKYENCVKIYNYFHDNKERILEIIV